MKEDVLFYVAIWGAVVSSVLALLRINEYRFSLKLNLYLSAIVKHPFKTITIVAYNKGKKPVSIKAVTICYGDFLDGHPFNKKAILEFDEKKVVKLSEGDHYMRDVAVSEVAAALHKVVPESGYNKRIFVEIVIVTGEHFLTLLHIDPSIIATQYPKAAQQFIATDLLMGYGSKEPVIVDQAYSK